MSDMIGDLISTLPSNGGDEEIPKGFRMKRIPVIQATSCTSAQEVISLASKVYFEEYPEFDKDAIKFHKEIEEALRTPQHQSCEMSCRSCPVSWCSRIAIHKEDLLSATYSIPIRSESSLARYSGSLMDALLAYLVQTKNLKRGLVLSSAEAQFTNIPSGTTGSTSIMFPDFSLVGWYTDSKGRNLSTCGIEMKLPHETFTFEHSTSRELIQELEEQFNAEAEKFSRGVSQCANWLVNAVSQTIFYALHTLSGTAALKTYHSFVAFRVSPPNDAGLIKVQVSKPYQIDGIVSVFSGVVTHLNRGIENVNKDWYPKFQAWVSNGLKLHGATPSFVPMMQRKTLVQMLTNPRGMILRNNKVVDNRSDGLDLVHCSRGDSKYTCITGSPDSVKSEIWKSCSCGKMFNLEVSKGSFLQLTEKEMADLFIRHASQIEGVGETGIVLRYKIHGVELAIKRWNWKTKDGLEALHNELKLFRMLHEHHREILGDVVPRVIALCDKPRTQVSLVFDFVGSALVRKFDPVKRKTMWYVDGDLLTDVDVEEISREATRGLQKLANCGIVHNDVAARNLRVKRITHPGGRGWRTWWIDFGYASYIPNAPFVGEWNLKKV